MSDVAANPKPGDFLVDWLSTHQPLSDEGRTMVAGYVFALIDHDAVLAGLADSAKLEYASLVWRDFRAHYDTLRDGSKRHERTDVTRALSKL